jgi:hypothetical protein
MTRLEIEGASTLVAEESDRGYMALTIDGGENWETIFLDYSDAFRLREWLSDWMLENQEEDESCTS